MYLTFKNAQSAFEYYYDKINKLGVVRNGYKSCFNIGFMIENPLDNLIKTPWRSWKKSYADFEWDWYLSANPNAEEISQRAVIWKNLMDDQGNVNSNYGFQWNRNDQLNKVVHMLKNDPTTRRASISLYDGKEIDKYEKDTVCTYAINFYITEKNLNMQVIMRSNDLVYGFCNDQYCFSKLQEMIANDLKLTVGNYYHFACDMHIYEKHYNLKK
jgi:thymidylate synthase